MLSIYSVLVALVLFSKLSSHTAAVAMPAAKLEDGAMDQDGRGPFLSDEPLMEDAMVSPKYRRGLLMDNDEEAPKVIIVSDMRLKGQRVRGLNPALTRALPFITDRSWSHTPAEPSLKMDRRDTDLDMLRCMIGRVYRPCWEA